MYRFPAKGSSVYDFLFLGEGEAREGPSVWGDHSGVREDPAVQGIPGCVRGCLQSSPCQAEEEEAETQEVQITICKFTIQSSQEQNHETSVKA